MTPLHLYCPSHLQSLQFTFLVVASRIGCRLYKAIAILTIESSVPVLVLVSTSSLTRSQSAIRGCGRGDQALRLRLRVVLCADMHRAFLKAVVLFVWDCSNCLHILAPLRIHHEFLTPGSGCKQVLKEQAGHNRAAVLSALWMVDTADEVRCFEWLKA